MVEAALKGAFDLGKNGPEMVTSLCPALERVTRVETFAESATLLS